MIDYSAYQRLQFSRLEHGVLQITMGSEQKLSHFDELGHAEIARVWRDVGDDDATRAVLIRGVGKGFSAGGSLEMVGRMTSDHALRMRIWRESRELVTNLVECSKPVVSAVHGPAAGAGLAVALLADVSIVARDARLIDGHSRLGVAAGDHAALVWPLLCGMAKAKQYLLLGDELNGAEAERIGLVSMCVDAAVLAPQALEIATRLARGPQAALHMTKLALNNWWRSAMPIFDASLGMEFLGFTGAEAAEGLAAVQQRREPRF